VDTTGVFAYALSSPYPIKVSFQDKDGVQYERVFDLSIGHVKQKSSDPERLDVSVQVEPFRYLPDELFHNAVIIPEH
jgi:hypothetical protein